MVEDNFLFWKNLIFIFLFLTITPVTILTSLFSLLYLNREKGVPENSIVHASPSVLRSGIKVYASLPSTFSTIDGVVTSADARVEIVRQFFESYNSPLSVLAPLIVEKADEFNLDFRLVPAIAMQESSGCKFIPAGTYNCLGWGIHSAGTLGFTSYEESIDLVSKGLKEEYLDKGYETIEEIMSKYTPLSPGSWAEGVRSFMGEME